MFVKICGLTDRAAIDAAIEAGADAIGFVFAESAREIEPERAHSLCDGIPADTIRVAVMHHPAPEHYARVVDTFDPDWVQTDAADFRTLPEESTARHIPVYRENETEGRNDFPQRLLFEGRISGSGATADWTEARRIAGKTELILAGGLNIENVATAIERVRPFGVDVSSGVESERGKKDAKKIREFVARVRALESQS